MHRDVTCELQSTTQWKRVFAVSLMLSSVLRACSVLTAPNPSGDIQYRFLRRVYVQREKRPTETSFKRVFKKEDNLEMDLAKERGLEGNEQMSEDLAKQLASYKAQLQQVEAALSGNGENEDLLKLKKDLQEVIELTKDLLSTQPSETLASSDNFASTQPTHSWKVGDKCMAIWSEDGQCYEAEIEEIDEENGTAAITFAGYGNAEVTPLLNLKPVEEGRKAKEDSGNKPMSKKEMIAQQREYKKKKALKKAQRIKELEQEREDQKVKWQQFNNRAYSKNKKGQVKRSIFASPESVTGKVGVGTCGIADKPMTQYQDTSKYNVRHLMPQ
ncbi:hypothetical protein MJT46_018318 [Ovis ammon polii x Ovis aries]|nr:hypothetical protein MJT46_018318 [Ovis ammon polii x Ovis aries]